MIRHLIFPLIWGLVLAIVTLIPGKNLESLPVWEIKGLDKLAHAVFYAILAVLIYNSSKSIIASSRKSIIITLSITVIYGISLEIIQMRVPDRTIDHIDIIANILGSVSGLVFARIMFK